MSLSSFNLPVNILKFTTKCNKGAQSIILTWLERMRGWDTPPQVCLMFSLWSLWLCLLGLCTSVWIYVCLCDSYLINVLSGKRGACRHLKTHKDDKQSYTSVLYLVIYGCYFPSSLTFQLHFSLLSVICTRFISFSLTDLSFFFFFFVFANKT